MILNESWLPVMKYEELYAISNMGRVKSLKKKILRSDGVIQTLGERIINGTVKDGYLRVVLYKNSKIKRMYVQVLTATHHVPNPNNKPEVGHLDGDKLNNRATNLEWQTRSENMKHAWDTGLRV